MDFTGGKENMNLMTVEGYAVPSGYGIAGSDHCFVVTGDRSSCWCNHGGGWSDERQKTKVARNRAYKEWLMEFIPPDHVDQCGITFGVNGVCQTYANRELLIGEDNANVSAASKNYVCLFFFGKYGLGRNQLKQLLKESYNKVTASYNDPYNALNKVLEKVDDYLDDELMAWYKVGTEYGHIPIDRILAKNPEGGKAMARARLQSLIDERENLYQKFLNKELDKWSFKNSVKELIRSRCDDYLNMLAAIRYISESEKNTWSQNISQFLNGINNALTTQMRSLEENGSISPDNIV